ncbi:response regulator [Auraticoccus monumenti]|uniref:DNA-binding response regulator, NarL/FixJ family, contains REC and HTH domains n=1 Tax=Auraticoccus monumenti TaxID=675864 RepID=A0A1G6RKK5_9ACTN|nr:response regulator transcription factor [Auraticoccus monumenti]SDD05098.1 DNA-binding response regulator, NarL/FixJ family, contains REC and HTH domains [Auraticoccus monumenti]
MIRVLIVDDHPLVRRGLAGVLDSAPDVELVGAVADGALAADAAADGRADIVLMDLSMPGMDGVEATGEVLARCPDTRVVVLTSFAEQARVLAALDAGAVGYLLKDSEPEDLLQAIREAAAGHAPISPRAALALLPARGPSRPRRGEDLSPREREVLALVAVGLPNKSIARRLQLSEKTVKAHLTRIFATLGVYDRTSAALWAQRNGLLEEENR